MTSTHAPAVDALRAAFAERDFSIVSGHLAAEVVLRSPVLETPWSTKPVLDRLGPAMVSIFDEVAFTDTAVVDRRAYVVFTAKLGETAVEGVHVVDLDAAGGIVELGIFIRPLPALLAVAEAMQAAVDPDLLRGHGR